MARRGRYILTAKRRAALRKAQLASARARKRAASVSKKKKRQAIAGGVAVGVLGAGVARHKISGSKISVRVAGGNSSVTGQPLKRSAPRVHSGPGVDMTGRRYRNTTVSTGRRTGGRAGILTYEHRALLGKKTKDKVPRYKEPPYVNMSNSINYKISQSAEQQAITKGKSMPGGAAESRVLKFWAYNNTAPRPKKGRLSTNVRSRNATVRRIMNELTGQGYKVNFE